MSTHAQRTAKQWATTRVAQVKQLVEDKFQNDLSLISQDEANQVVRDCQAAVDAYKADPNAASGYTASHACWAVLLTQAVVARRPEGWQVDSCAAQAVWNVRRMHEHIREFAGEQFMGDGMNQVMEQSMTRGTVSGVAHYVVNAASGSRRRTRVDNLGNDEDLKQKARMLHRLLRAAGLDGLPDAIIDLELPTVRTLASTHQQRMRDAICDRWAAGASAKTKASAAAGRVAAVLAPVVEPRGTAHRWVSMRTSATAPAPAPIVQGEVAVVQGVVAAEREASEYDEGVDSDEDEAEQQSEMTTDAEGVPSSNCDALSDCDESVGDAAQMEGVDEAELEAELEPKPDAGIMPRPAEGAAASRAAASPSPPPPKRRKKRLTFEQLLKKQCLENQRAKVKAERKRQAEAKLKVRLERVREKLREKADRKRKHDENATEREQRKKQRIVKVAARANVKLANVAKCAQARRERQAAALGAAMAAGRPAAAPLVPQAPGELKLKLFVPTLKLKLPPTKPQLAEQAQRECDKALIGAQQARKERKEAREARESSSAPIRGVAKASSKAKLVRVRLGGAGTLTLFG